MDSARFLAVAGEALQSINESAIVSDSAMVSEWLAMDDIGAIRAIKAQVNSSDAADADRLDGFLLALASNHFDSAVRTRLVKFYAMFKIVQLLRDEKFRGFPA